MKTLTTERLILRPWREEDAPALYEYAKDPRVGPITGWPVHTSVEDSLRVIRGPLSDEGTLAVTIKELGDSPVGSVGIMEPRDVGDKAADREIGYWIGVPFWGRGYIPEAVRELMRYCFEELGCQNVWCGHYEGNEKSKRVIEKCGFRFVKSEVVDVALMNERRREYFYVINKSEWQK